jgi:hypothetical protein
LVADKAARQQILGLVKHNDTDRQAAKIASVLIQVKDSVLAKRGDRTRTYPFLAVGCQAMVKKRKGEKARRRVETCCGRGFGDRR